MRERQVKEATPERAARRAARLERHEQAGREIPTTITALTGDAAHRGERMSLFILIVLGEGIVQLTVAAEASDHWDRALFTAAIGAFLLVCGLFLIGVVRGTAGLARLEGVALPARALWVCHLIVAMSLVTLVAALGQLLEEPREPINLHTALMLTLGLGAYALISALALLASAPVRRWALTGAVCVPMLVGAALVLVAHLSITASAVAWILAVAVAAASLLGGAVLNRRRSEPIADAD
jgi:low temperature requirement protein LtrA